MKPIIPFALLGALFAVGAATAATTTPVGYATESLAPNRDNLIGLTLHQPTVAAGVIDAETATSITDNEVNFGTALTAGATYILEITSGTGDGVIQEVVTWSGSTLTTPQDITASVTPGTTTYSLRKASTVADVFGVNNSVGLTPSSNGSTTTSDVLLIPDGAGGFTTVFYYNDGTDQLWLDGSFNEAANFPLVYTDGVIVRRKAGSPISLVVSGEVKTGPTRIVVSPGDNYVSSIYPVGSELANSTLGTQILPSTNGSTTTADVLLFPDGAGGYTSYFYYNDGTDQLWLDGSFNDATNTAFKSGYVFQSKSGAAKELKHDVPTFYNSL